MASLLPGTRGLDDGRLLTAAEAAGYGAFLTVDQSLRLQQNLAGRRAVVLLLRARSNRLGDLEPLAPAVLAAPPSAPAGVATVAPRNVALQWPRDARPAQRPGGPRHRRAPSRPRNRATELRR